MATEHKKVQNTGSIKEQQLAEQLEVEKHRLLSLINSMADGVLSVDKDGKIISYNGAALDVLDVNSIKPGNDVSSVLKLLDEKERELDTRSIVVNTQQQTISRDYKLRYTDGSVANIYLSIAPVHLGYGKSGESGFVIIVRDITREKSLEEERDEFISVVSHELRTPVAVTEGAVSNALFIAEKNDPESPVAQSLKAAHHQIVYLEDMINDLSTLSRADRGVLDAKIEDINAHDLVQHLKEIHTSAAKDKGLEIHVDIDPELTLFRSRRLYVEEILQNFVTNAIKYTEKGSVTIGAHQKNGGVEFTVSDTGIGISKGDQALVFDKFFRSENSLTRAQNGTGLGLHVTRKIAQLAGAKISLQSELGKGSTFTVFFAVEK